MKIENLSWVRKFERRLRVITFIEEHRYSILNNNFWICIKNYELPNISIYTVVRWARLENVKRVELLKQHHLTCLSELPCLYRI